MSRLCSSKLYSVVNGARTSAAFFSKFCPQGGGKFNDASYPNGMDHVRTCTSHDLLNRIFPNYPLAVAATSRGKRKKHDDKSDERRSEYLPLVSGSLSVVAASYNSRYNGTYTY